VHSILLTTFNISQISFFPSNPFNLSSFLHLYITWFIIRSVSIGVLPFTVCLHARQPNPSWQKNKNKIFISRNNHNSFSSSRSVFTYIHCTSISQVIFTNMYIYIYTYINICSFLYKKSVTHVSESPKVFANIFSSTSRNIHFFYWYLCLLLSLV
jgi:hypothetical protein